MKDTHLAAILYGAEDLRLENVSISEIGPEEVLVQVKACALCGSDLHAYLGKHPKIVFPIILGHEFAGVICQKGKNVSGWEIGQRVCASPTLPCGKCDPCRQGKTNICVEARSIGFNVDGAYSQYVIIPQQNLYFLPDSVSFDEASMIQTLTVAYNGVKRRGEIKIQDQVLIFGCGPIGLCALVAAKASGAKVVMVDTLDYRLSIAKTMGADEAFNSAKVDIVKSTLDLTRGRGIDKVIEAVGGEQDITLGQTTQVVKRGGLIVLIGTFSMNKATLRITEFKARELELRGSQGGPGAWQECIDLVASRRLRLEPLISHRLSLQEVEKGLQLMRSKTENVMKVIIHP
jgi:L-iditol 2-dehydrogenase